jgi:5-hydroxyisourate hydrolase-like protein (transthyretin family)
MATNRFNIKRNDTSPFLAGVLKDADGNVKDLSGATVRFHMVDKDETTIVDTAAVVTNATAGRVKYEWVAADTATSGGFRGEFEVTYSDATIETYPNTGYIPIRIYEDLL